MANKKVKPSEDFYDFLPQRVQESTKLGISEKNVLATLCYYRLKYSDYAKEHDGWFYTSQKELEEGTELSHAQLNRVITKLRYNKPSSIQTKSGTNHRCTHYKLHPKIDELLPKDEVNETLAVEDSKNINETLVEKTTVEIHNETLDKIRLDKTSQDKTSLIVSISKEKNDDVGETLGGDFTKSSDIEKMIDEGLNTVTTFKELSEVGTKLRELLSKNNKPSLKNLLNEKIKLKADEIRVLTASTH
jgi:hypothetical protein